MNQKADIELPLITSGKVSPKGSQYDDESKHLLNKNQTFTNSHFTEYIEDSKHPDKYAPPAPFFQWLTFSDMLPYVKKINNSENKLKFQDLPKPEEKFSVGNKLLELDSHWNKELEKEKPSFAMALYKTFYGEFTQGTLLFLTDCTARMFYSIYMGRIVNVITQSNFGEALQSDELFSSGLILSLLVLISVMSKSWGIYIMAGMIGKARFSISGLLYKKLNSVSLTSIHEIKIGKVINLLGNDLNDLQGLISLPNLFITPYLIILGTYLMYHFVGGSSFVGLGLLMAVLFGQVFLSNSTEEPRKENKKTTDQRVKITHEVIEGIRLIKMYTWSQVFAKKITNLRESEYKTFLKITHIDALSRNLSSLSVYLIVLVVCLTFIASGGVLSTEILYATMMILMNLSSNLLSSHLGRMNFVNFKMIVGRVQEVLMIKDVLLKEETTNMNSKQSLLKPLVFKNFEGYWNKNSVKPSLSNLNLTFAPGSLTAIIGKIGAGKSTFLLSLLRELPVTKGIMNISGSLAYVEQDPIIFSGTFRENILFGREFNEPLYNKVIRDCCLEKDLEMFSHGDMTLIGERGVNISGGQKARVSLARALYSQSDIYLLDDPFSALDSRVARNIFDRVIRQNLAKNKIVILVTHHLYFAKESDHVVLMDEGQITAQGQFEDLEKLNISLLNVLKVEEEKRRMSEHRGSSEAETQETEKKEKTVAQPKQKTTKEEFADLSWGTYRKYLQATGTTKTFVMLITIFIASHIIMIYYSRFLGYWAEDQYRYYNQPDQVSDDFSNFYYITVCLFLLAVIFVISYLKTVKLYGFLLATNTEIHQRMLNSLLRSKVLFFDINPTGRIINRFSNDIGLLDKTNPRMTYDLVDNAISYVSVVVTVCIFNVYILVPSVLVIYGLFHIRKMFDKPMTQVKELELAAKSPMLSAAPTTLHGLIIIRAYSQGGRFIKEFMEMIYDSMRAYIFREKMIRIFGLMLDTPVQFLTLSGIWIFITLISSINFDSALLGLCLMYLLKIGDQGSLLIRQSLYLDISMQSAQRMLDFCEIESEAPEYIPHKDNQVEKEFDGKWPTTGDIVFNKVHLRYREGLNFALNNLCLDIKGGTKIACVGRTGAGKSSIIQALFRMVEIEKASQYSDSFIKIDNVDISEIGLDLLRGRISIIPQTPAIFTGTVKRNLDPLEKLSNFEVWQILSEVGLKDYVSSLPEQLNTDMTVSATVFSTGQKQLICLARALINKSKVIILDEATANVDVETDSLIQKTIMTKFKDCTVLTVAHRLITIANYDKAVVIESGCVAEYDSPYKLMVENIGDDEISKRNGLFAEMVKSTGKSMSKTIFQIAHQHYYHHSE